MGSSFYSVLVLILFLIFVFNILFTRTILQPGGRKNNHKHDKKPEKLIIYLGSGGHTGEMLKILGTYEETMANARVAVLYSDENSLLRFKKQFSQMENVKFYEIGKARQVNASKISSLVSILKTLRSIAKLFAVEKDYFLLNHKRTLLLLNGPGSCVLLAALFQLMKLLTFKDYANFRIVYIESLARCNNLSMTGVLVYFLKLSDEFIVQWPELCIRYPYSKCYGLLV